MTNPGQGRGPSEDNSHYSGREQERPNFDDTALPAGHRPKKTGQSSGPLQINHWVDNYRVVQFVGRGGLSHIYRAIDRAGEEFALKVGADHGGGNYLDRALSESAPANPDRVNPAEYPANVYRSTNYGIRREAVAAHEIDKFIREEAQLLKGCEDLGFPRIHEVIEHRGRPVMVSEFVRGSTLRQRMQDERAQGIIDPDPKLLIKIAALLEKCHNSELEYHGDLKPENIIISRKGEITLIDPSTALSEVDAYVTTANYNPLLSTDKRADVMGFGIIMYEWYTTILPFDEVPYRFAGLPVFGDIDRNNLSNFLSHYPPKEVNHDIPDKVAGVITRALSHPEYSMSELLTDLRKI